MSEVQSQSAPRGRGSARGGRAAFGSRGGSGRGGRTQTASSTKLENASQPPPPAVDESPELTQLKKQYGTSISLIRDMFPGWTDEDSIYALQENDGDLEITVEKIADGTLKPFGNVDSKKERSKSKAAAKELSSATLTESTNAQRGTRGARGSSDAPRGGRGRGSDRGARGATRGRGAAVASTNGNARSTEAPETLSVPTEDAWASSTKQEDSLDTSATTGGDGWGSTVTETVTAGAAAITDTVASVASSIIPEGAKKSWASMFKTEPVPEKKAAPTPAAPAEKAPEPEPETVADVPVVEEAAAEIATEDIAEPEPETEAPTTPTAEREIETPSNITPSKDELTETNLEQLPDVSHPISTETAASTTADSTATYAQQPSAIRPPPISASSGFAATAQKATAVATPQRLGSFQRRTLDQEEAVRMPGNREVDRAAVKFGNFNLGSEDDVDGEREEPETRAQPPQHSPVSQPRASLPSAPATQQSLPPSLPSPKENQGLSSAPAAAPGLPSPQGQSASQSMAQQGSQSQYAPYGRYGQGSSQEHSSFGQKPYDPFSQQAPGTQSGYDGYGQQSHSQAQQQPSAFSSAPADYSSYYGSNARNDYSGYYGHQYGQQGSQSQDAPASQRAASGFGAPSQDNASSYGQTAGAQSRYSAVPEGNNSGHSTPNPVAQGQAGAGQGQSQGHPGQQPNTPGGAYPYGNPYYSQQSPYYSAYMNQYQGYGGGYGGGPYGGKGGMYNQSHGYGMPPQTPYDQHAASPAAGGFGQSAGGRDGALGGSAGLGEYGRVGSQQASQTAGGSNPFGAMGESYGRNSSYQGHNQHYGQHGNQAGGDDLKPYGEGKNGNGPSPLLAQAARPGSAANNGPGQSALPPPQQQSSQAYNAYPGSHLGQGHGTQSTNQYGLGGAGYGQAGTGHQSSQYGYGGFGGNSYGNNQQRGGWGNNYGGGH